MKIPKTVGVTLAFLLLGGFGIPSMFSQETAPKPSDGKAPAKAQPSEAEMMAKMLELGQPGENHKLLAALVGTWECKVTFWMAPGAPPSESSGIAVRKPIMDGRYFLMDTAAKMQMPGPDGVLHPVDFKGMEIDGFDNVKGKFFSTWIDSMGTSLLLAEGTYDPATKTFTYFLEEEMLPGVKTKVRQTVKVIDQNHHIFEWFENRDGKETKTMEITYTKKSVKG